jgi:hypothetical protein
MTQSRGPLIVAIVLLLLPMLYVGSYFATVRPVDNHHGYVYQYPRIGSSRGRWIFWPLEQLDRNVRPDNWRYEKMDPIEWQGELQRMRDNVKANEAQR